MSMKKIFGLLYVLCEYLCFVACNSLIESHELLVHHHHGENDVSHFTNVWYFHSTNDDLDEVHDVIIQNGFSYAEPVHGIPNVYKAKMESHPEIHHEPAHHNTNVLKQHDKVNWAKQGFTRNLHKRMPTTTAATTPGVRSRYERYFNDELWNLQWYEQDYRGNCTNDTPLDMNLVPVYEQLKYTGKGIRVAIIDDGIEYTHDDLKDNYDKEISINLNWNKTDPMPRYEDPTNTHGTRCAGEIAMAANNTKCGVGVAYNAKVGGIVLLDGETNDEMEAAALLNALMLVDIYSGSWGPKDDGLSVDGPGVIAQMAFEIGATKGRNGRGAIYVFASGNGRIQLDNCAADGYVGNIHTVAISSATIDGKAPAYAERCAAVIATAYSGGIDSGIKIVTSDINNTCTLNHSGTSAAAPLAAGVIALALEANAELTWRDVQHLLARNCETAPLMNNLGWSTNAAGFRFNPQFGFGLLNGYKLVKEAAAWRTVPEKFICAVDFDIPRSGKYFGRVSKFVSSVNVDGCDGHVKHLEHVQLSMTVKHPKRGVVEVDLRSPKNTVCKMMEPRPLDESDKGFLEWKIKSLQYWGEDPFGEWTVFIKDETSSLYAGLFGSVEKLTLIMHGTREHPYN
ncbi:Peptidase S8, subtilisin-related,Peptidase S8, subtilisin, Ser-active site,Proprotein convertase [Cinara cedri]|uniref:Peptidase S8, subtilisin-related,Peptidase S8, subtilisin, Ser-active site,Proprotein convertase n=1 Tax=Cinara cedri TaxID=506608 RepID=A0A5E4NKP2_9HEMI|nr:Peptidase S8, subtilisin-related,Peptidase S8, subtilisin, Ser-active site,Proprotein convertase [Cinara cedri]